VGVVIAAPSPDGTHNVTDDAPSAELATPADTAPTAVKSNRTRLIGTAPSMVFSEQRTTRAYADAEHRLLDASACQAVYVAGACPRPRWTLG
jgi:hypothetical protein